MRDLVFKNLTSLDRRKRIVTSTDVEEKSGMRTKITRHLICLVKEITPSHTVKQPLPYLYVLKERNTKEGRQRFICRIKGSIYTINNSHLYLVTFVHSLRINLKVLAKGSTGTVG